MEYSSGSSTSGSSTSGSSTTICELCKQNNQLYTCPRCGIKYCGLECYKSEAHLDCSESFYKQCVTDELKCQESDPDDRKKMLEILKRIEAADLEEILEDDKEGDDIYDDEDCPLDSDDEELLDLETRLQNVNFENPDELWSVLSDTEKQEFESLLKNGEVEKILPAWTPWWIHSVQKKITELNEEDIEVTDVSKLPAIVDVPLFPELQKASSSVQFNIVNVIHAYAYIALYYYGDYLNCSEDATCVFLMICENIRNNTVFENVDLAIESVIKCIKSVDWLARDEQTLTALREAGNSIWKPVTGEKTIYISAALSELHRLLTAAKTEISKDKSANAKQEFIKRFPQKYYNDVHLSKKSIFLSLKKLEYYLSYVKRYGNLV